MRKLFFVAALILSITVPQTLFSSPLEHYHAQQVQIGGGGIFGGGIGNIVEDTTPQLGGDLDGNGFDVAVDAANDFTDGGVVIAPILETTASCGDTGDGNPSTLALDVDFTIVRVTNNDSDGCDVTLGETYGIKNRVLVVENAGANTITFSDSAGVQQLNTTFVGYQNDNISFHYSGSQWVNTAREVGTQYGIQVKLEVEVTTTTTDYATTVDGMSFAVAANKDYSFIVKGLHQSADAAAGVGFSFDGPASPDDYVLECSISDAADTGYYDWENTYEDITPSAAVGAANTSQPFGCSGMLINGSNAGTMQLEIETSVSGTAAKVEPGTYLLYREIP